MKPITPWPKVLPNDDGIRPAGPQDQCLYCRKQIGEEHGRECVAVTKRVRITHTFALEHDVPAFWEEATIMGYYQDSSACASNIVDQLAAMECQCDIHTVASVEVIDDTPRAHEKQIVSVEEEDGDG